VRAEPDEQDPSPTVRSVEYRELSALAADLAAFPRGGEEAAGGLVGEGEGGGQPVVLPFDLEDPDGDGVGGRRRRFATVDAELHGVEPGT
jgi:hypothetical protein